MANDQTPPQMTLKTQKSSSSKQIDESLKRVYEDALNEDVPDKFLDLIAKLKASEETDDGK